MGLTSTRGTLSTRRQMLSLKPKPRAKQAPAKSWRNFYRVYQVLNLGRTGHWFPGIHPGPDAFPSKEIAEEHGLALVRMINPPGRWFLDHAGAFPEGEAPN